MSRLLNKFDLFIRDSFLNEDSKPYFRMMNFITFFVFVSVFVMIVESTYPKNQIPLILKKIDIFILILFTFDYLANIYVAKNKKKYIFSFYGVIDLLAVLPSLIGLVSLSSIKMFKLTRVLLFLRFMRLLRVLRILKLSKNIKSSVKNGGESLSSGDFKISLQIYFMSLFFVLVFFSSLMYYVEGSMEGSGFSTIPNAMWWCMGIITNTGSEIQPQTPLGRIITSFAMISGLALFGLLMNVIGKSLMIFLFGSSKVDSSK